MVVEGLAEYKWYERAIVTEAKIKAYFRTTLTSWRKLLAEAEASERPVVAAMAVGETIVRGEITASESEGIDNNGSVNNAFDVVCHKVEMINKGITQSTYGRITFLRGRKSIMPITYINYIEKFVILALFYK